MNGGMYDDNFSPVGLYIENGKELTRANTITLTGTPSQIPNFYKKPNGVFFIGDGEAGMIETGRFLAHRPKARFATQSGPMLLIDGIPSGLHRGFNRPQAAQRRWRVEPHRGAFRYHRGTRELLRLCALFPRRPWLQQRPFLDGGTAPGSFRRSSAGTTAGHGGYGPSSGWWI